MDPKRVTTALGAVLLFGAVPFFMAACAEAPPETASLPDVPVDPDAAPPHIEFASSTFDFGVMPEIETRRGSFTFTNTGGRPLVIDDIAASCGCTVPTLAKRRYEPGESGEIMVEFKPSASGDQKKWLSIVSNSEPDEVARLTIIADVTPFVDLEPEMLTVDDLVLGQVSELAVIASCADASFVIEAVTATNEHVSARVVEPADEPTGEPTGAPSQGATRTIIVTIAPTAPWGGFFSWLEVTSSARPGSGAEPVTHTRKMRIQGQVSGALTAQPHTFRFGLKPGERLERRVKVWRPSGEPFALDDVELEVTGLDDANVRVEPAGPGGYELILTARGPSRPTPSRGRVIFRTDVAGEERLEIPIVGVVRVASRGVR